MPEKYRNIETEFELAESDSEKEKLSLKDKALARNLEYEKDVQLFEYGELAADHPTLLYVKELAAKLPKRGDKDIEITVCPDWRESNAGAFPDGSVYISGGLIKDAETDEGLLGVIAHERIHYAQQHAKKQNEKIPSRLRESKPKTWFELVSLKRGHEYDADLRGALVDLEKANVNPLGYKALLEKIHRRSADFGLSHGSAQDRALNIASAIHLVDFRSLAQDLHEIPQEHLDAMEEAKNSRSVSVAMRRAVKENATEEEIDANREVRRNTVENLSLKELLLVISRVYSYTNSNYGEEGEDPDDNEIFRSLLNRFDSELLPSDLNNADRDLLRVAVQFVFADINPFSIRNKVQKEENEHVLDSLKSIDNLIHMADLLKEFLSKSETVYSLDTGGSLVNTLVDRYAAEDVFKNGDQWDLDKINKFVDGWAPVVDLMRNNFDQYVNTDKTPQKIIVEYFLDLVTDEQRQALQERYELVEAKDANAQRYHSLGIEVAQEKEYKDFYSQLNRVFSEIKIEFKDAPQAEIGKFISEMMVGIFKGQEFVEEKELLSIEKNYPNKQAREKEISFFLASQALISPELAVMHIFEKCLEQMDQFSHFDTSQKQLLLLSLAHRLDLSINEIEEEIGLDTSVLPDKYDVRHIPKWKNLLEVRKNFRKKIENYKSPNKVYTEAISADDAMVEFAKDSMLQKNFWLENFGLKDARIYDDAMERNGEAQREEIFAIYIINKLAQENLADIPKCLERWADGEINLYSVIEDNNRYCGPLILQLANEMEKNNLTNYEISDLVKISRWIREPVLQNAFQRYVKELKWQDLSFEQKLDLVFPLSGMEGISDPATQESFMETEINTKEQYHLAKQRLIDKSENFLVEGNEMAGVAVLLSSINFKHNNPNTLMKALLTSSVDERSLKILMYESVGDIVDIENYTTRDITTRAKLAAKIVNGLYTLDGLGRQLLLRQLLTAEWGILNNKERRKEFFDFLFNEWIKPDENQSDIHSVLLDIKSSLENTEDWELLYFAFQGALMDKIAIPPQKKNQTPWSDLYEIEEDMANALGDKEVSQNRLNRLLGEIEKANLPEKAKKQPHKYNEEYLFMTEQKLRDFFQKTGIFSQHEAHQYTPLQFVKDIISKTGAQGVRFLQVMPQFVKLAKEYEKEFVEVFDGMKGQSKLAALALLEREWPELWDTIEMVEERIGGGSAVTVYKALTKQGKKVVLKVRNPNIEYHLNETYRFAKLISDDLASQLGGNYEIAGSALDDIQEWITQDISFSDFIEQDKKFSETNQGFSPDKYDYKIKIPQSYLPESKYFAVEELIEGKNLTQWDDLVTEGHDMKQVSTLILKNYVKQIMSGQAHSDVHIGNFRVTPNNEVAILDRNFFLEISETEQKLIQSMLNPFLSMDGKKQLVMDYLAVPEHSENAQAIEDEIGNFAELLMDQKWNLARKSLIDLKQKGVKIPLNFTLLMKNFNSIGQILKRAGFKNFAEAYMYSPTQSE